VGPEKQRHRRRIDLLEILEERGDLVVRKDQIGHPHRLVLLEKRDGDGVFLCEHDVRLAEVAHHPRLVAARGQAGEVGADRVALACAILIGHYSTEDRLECPHGCAPQAPSPRHD
jgi:hypothetical protein